MASSVTAARRAMERELKQAEGDVERLKNAIRALVAYENPRSSGVRMPSRGKDKVCETPGCGTHYRAFRKDAKFCSDCRVVRRDAQPRTDDSRAKAAARAVRDRNKGTTIVKNTPSASSKKR